MSTRLTSPSTHGESRSGTSASNRRVAPLDGVRGVAILAIMAFHSGVPGLDVGGYYSQDAFFVLSGMLITLILLQESKRSHTIRLVKFYAGRIRRLIPALLVMLVVVALYVELVAPSGEYPGFRDDALSVLGYFSNWHFISVGASYWAEGAAPSLLTHTWSLAIEEQFYLIWPLVLIAVLRLTGGKRRRGLIVVLGVSFGGALLSSGWMAFLYRSGATTTRLYYGTDTHAQSILIGCALGTLLAMIKDRRGVESLVPIAVTVRARRLLSVVGLAAALGLAWQWTHIGGTDPFAYEGGFLLGALLTALVLASASCVPFGPLAVVLSLRWLRYVGTISYGMYLWYFPVFQYVDGARTGQTGLRLFVIRVAVDMAIATCSYFLIELPVRQGTLFRFESTDWRLRTRSLGLLALSLVLTLGVVVGTTAGSSVAIGPPAAPAATSSSAATAAGVTRLLLVGDSTALTLGFALPTKGPGWNVAIDQQGVEGCGVAIGSLLEEDGVVMHPVAPCNSATPVKEQWPDKLRRLVATDKPDVVALLAGRWEVANRFFDGRWMDILDSPLRSYVERQLRLAVQIGTASGAHMVLLTAPCYSSGEQPDGSPWPNDSPQRLKAYNDLLYEVAAEHPSTASVVNLNAIVCPGGRFESTIDGVTIRAPDGIHFPFYRFGDPLVAAPDTLVQVDAFANWIGPRLMPEIVARAKAPVTDDLYGPARHTSLRRGRLS